jgi:hypothetical protein
MTRQKSACSQVLAYAMPRPVSFTVMLPYSAPLAVVVGHWPAAPGYRDLVLGGYHGMIPEDLFTRIPYESLLTPYLTLTTHLATRRPVPSSSALARRKTDGGMPPVSVSKEGLCCSTAYRTSRTASITS